MQLLLKKDISMKSLKKFGFQEYYQYFEKMISAKDFDVRRIKHLDQLSHFYCLFDDTKTFYIAIGENREIHLLMINDMICEQCISPRIKRIEITQLLFPIIEMVKKDLIEINQ